MGGYMESWQDPVKIKDIAGLPIEDQKKAAFIMVSYLDTFDTTLLIELASKIMQVLRDRGLGEDLGGNR